LQSEGIDTDLNMCLQEERIIFISTVLSRPETLPPLAAASRQARQDDVHLGFWWVLPDRIMPCDGCGSMSGGSTMPAWVACNPM
jgi:hypothetical protein